MLVPVIVICYLFIVLVIYRCCSFILLNARFSFIPCTTYVHCSLFKRKRFIPGILIPLYKKYPFNVCTCVPSSSMQVNKHHTSDCTDFVLVWEREAYYDHRHSRIDKTNILQEVIAVHRGRDRSEPVFIFWNAVKHPINSLMKSFRIVQQMLVPRSTRLVLEYLFKFE